MKNKFFNTILSCVIMASLLFGNSVCATEGGETTNLVGIEHYLGDTKLEKDAEGNDPIVFAGEVFKTHVYVDNMAIFASWGMDFHFDATKVKLVSFEDSTTLAAEGLTNKKSIKSTGSNGVKLNKTFDDTWANGEGDIVVNEQMPYISNNDGYIWLYGNVDNKENKTGLADKTTVLEFNFKAQDDATGNPNIRFAVAGGVHTPDPGLVDGILFSVDEQSLTVNRDIQYVNIQKQPEAPTVEWNEYVAEWDPVFSRGYEVRLYKDGDTEPVKEVEDLATDVNRYDFSDDMTTPGDYYFVVTAKGGTYSTDSQSKKIEVTIPLDDVEKPIWDTTQAGKLTWTKVENATEYVVTIYKKDEATDTFVVIDTKRVTNENSAELVDKMLEAGEYRATVQAFAPGTGYTESKPSPESEIFYSGTNINGYVKLDHVENTGDKAKMVHGNIKVELYYDKTVDDGNGGTKIVKALLSDKVTTTAQDGSFELKAIPSGTYDIVLHGDGVVTRIIPNVSLIDDEFILSTLDKPIDLYQGNLFRADDKENEFGNDKLTFINPTDISEMVKLVGLTESDGGYNPVGNFDFDTADDTKDLLIVLDNAGKNTNSYPNWEIPQQ